MLSRGLAFHAVVWGGDIMWAVLFVAGSQIEIAGKVLRGGRYRGLEGGKDLSRVGWCLVVAACTGLQLQAQRRIGVLQEVWS